MRHGRIDFTDVIGLLVLAAVVAAVFWAVQPPSDGGAGDPVRVGSPMPPIEVAGWLNIPEEEAFNPSGKVVVVDLWASWCGPCRLEVPRLARVAERYRPLGVEFVALTSETERDLPRIREYLRDTPEFDWPLGYGAMDFWNALEVEGIPLVVVYGRDGRARWSATGAGATGLEAALDEALAQRER